MNLEIMNDCAGSDNVLQTAGTDPGRRYKDNIQFSFFNPQYWPDLNFQSLKKITFRMRLCASLLPLPGQVSQLVSHGGHESQLGGFLRM